MFRLYAGLIRDSKHFNHVELDELKGGILTVMDGDDKSGVSKTLNMIKAVVKKIYTKDGEERVLTDMDYQDLKIEDAWKIGLEVQKQYTGEQYPINEEFFFCKVCSNVGDEKYTHIKDSWLKLIEEGMIDEYFLDKPDNMRVLTELPHGLQVPPMGSFQGGTFKKIWREPLSFRDMNQIVHTPGIMLSESKMIYATWEMQIKEIEGMSNADLTRFVKRNLADSFLKKYLHSKEDINAMKEYNPVNYIGLKADERLVTCNRCGSQIGGYLDFTNFFDFLSPSQSHRKESSQAMSL